MGLFVTDDGSHSIHSERFGVPYHSKYGARTESEHVFMDAGFRAFAQMYPKQDTYRVLEYGIGTGLNALLCYHESITKEISISYTGIELYPIGQEWTKLNYLGGDLNHAEDFFKHFHESGPSAIAYSATFQWHVLRGSFQETEIPSGSADIIFFDAFAPNAQEELWTEEIFRKCYGQLTDGGVWVSYCAKGEVRRRLQRTGFTVERIPGPPGKREMLRAWKNPPYLSS